MIRGLWDRQVEAIIDVKLGDADVDSYKYESMAALFTKKSLTNSSIYPNMPSPLHQYVPNS